jgi:hypothetical protein
LANVGDTKVSDSCLRALYRARSYAQAISDGSLTPYEGARRIWNESFHDCFNFLQEGSDLVDRLGVFTAYADDWEDHEDRPDMSEHLRRGEGQVRARIEADIRACATEYLQLFARALLPHEQP